MGLNSISLTFLGAVFSIHSSVHASVARVVTLRGAVDLFRNGKATGALHVGDGVESGDVLKTQENSALKLLFSDRTIVDLGAKSEFKVNQFLLNKTSDRKVDLELVNGKMRTSVNEKVTGSGDFKVKSKSVVMGVRGTEFVVESAEAIGPEASGVGQTQITVLEGSVAVESVAPSSGSGGSSPGSGALGVAGGTSGALSAGTGVSLSAGQQMNSSSTSAVQTLSADQTSKVSQGATVSDRSFQMAVNLEAPSEARAESKPESRQEGKTASASENKSDTKTAPRSGGPEAGGSKSSGSGSGNPPPPPAALLAVIQTVTNSVSMAPPPMIDMGTMKTPGAMNDTQSMPPPNLSPINLTIGQPVKINVTFGP